MGLKLDNPNNRVTVDGTNEDLDLRPDGTGNLVLDGLKWPQSDGTNGQSVVTNGSGQLAWGGGTGITAVVEDTSPELGGDLDLNAKNLIDGVFQFRGGGNNNTNVVTALRYYQLKAESDMGTPANMTNVDSEEMKLPIASNRGVLWLAEIHLLGVDGSVITTLPSTAYIATHKVAIIGGPTANTNPALMGDVESSVILNTLSGAAVTISAVESGSDQILRINVGATNMDVYWSATVRVTEVQIAYSPA